MKKKISLMFLFSMIFLSIFAQSANRKLEVYSITEYIDGYVIKAIDKSKSDTLNIVSLKESDIINEHDFEKIIVGGKYNFEFEDLVKKMSAIPSSDFVLRIKTTVIWKNGDRIKNVPVFSINTNGLWIKKQSGNVSNVW